MNRLPALARLGLAVLLVAVACHTPRRAAEDYAVVSVDNRSPENLTVYMVTDDGQRYRLGDAPALHHVRLTLGESRIREVGLVQIVATQTSGLISATSDRVRLEVGDSLVLIVPR